LAGGISGAGRAGVGMLQDPRLRGLLPSGSAAYLGRAASNVNRFGEGGMLNQPIRDMGRMTGMWPGAAPAPTGIAGRYGRTVAGLGATILGTSALTQGGVNRLEDTMDNYANTRVPQWTGAIDQHITNRLGQMGLLNQQGQVDPLHTIGNSLRNMFSGGAGNGAGGMGMMNHIDSMFHAIGMDPTRMSPVQKLMILAGTGVGGAGDMTGNPILAGGGGLALLGGLIPHLMGGNQGSTGGQGMPQIAGAAGGSARPPVGLPVNALPQRNELEQQQRLQR
jgi:hypothetical protein